jgi:hypothetical protein
VTPGTHRAFFAIVLQITSRNSGWVLEWAQLVPLATALRIVCSPGKNPTDPRSRASPSGRGAPPRVGNNFPRWRATSMRAIRELV